MGGKVRFHITIFIYVFIHVSYFLFWKNSSTIMSDLLMDSMLNLPPPPIYMFKTSFVWCIYVIRMSLICRFQPLSEFICTLHKHPNHVTTLLCAAMCTIPCPMGQSLCWSKFDMKLTCCLAFTFVIADFLVDKPSVDHKNLYSFIHCIKMLMIVSKLTGYSHLVSSSWSDIK